MCTNKKNKLTAVTQNLFGASVASLIAACGDRSISFGISKFTSNTSSGGNQLPTGEDPSQNNLSAPSLDQDFAAGIPDTEASNLITSSADITVTWSKTYTVTLDINIAKTSNTQLEPVADIYQLASTIEYDLVVSAAQFKGGAGVGTKGAHYIYWNIKQGEIANSKRLAVEGLKSGDHIGKYMPVFMNVNKGDGFDMIIRSDDVDFDTRTDTRTDAGAVYILWNVATYKGNTATVTLDASNGNTNILAIYGEKEGDRLAEGNENTSKRVSFLDIGKKTDNLDALIESKEYGSTAGAFYILWDVAQYAASKTTIDLSSITADKGLAIHGAVANDRITLHDPEFLKVGGNATNLDMVIRSQWISYNNQDNTGAIYILWDIDTIATNTIDLSALANNPNINSLTIAGGSDDSLIGSIEPKFVYMSNDTNNDANYDMIVTSGSISTAGAIFVLWDIDNYKDSDKVINVGSLTSKNDNVLSIYGDSNDYLGGDTNNVLYNGNGKLSDIDGNRTNDIAFQSSSYTYVLFGEKVAEADINGNVTSKTIDLAAINAAFTNNTNAGYFNYDFTKQNNPVTLASKDDATGYRFEDRNHSSLSDVDIPTSLVSDHSGDWDIL